MTQDYLPPSLVVFRLLLLVATCTVLLFVGLSELLVSHPMPLWLYLTLAGGFVVSLLETTSRKAFRKSALRTAGFLAVLGILHVQEWSPRKPFLRDLWEIEKGMSLAQVRKIMSRYPGSTNWPASARRQSAGTEKAGQEHLVFWHTSHPAGGGNCDVSEWGGDSNHPEKQLVAFRLVPA